MVEFLAYWLMIGILVNCLVIFLSKSNPDGSSVMAACLMWPIILWNIIQGISIQRKDE